MRRTIDFQRSSRSKSGVWAALACAVAVNLGGVLPCGTTAVADQEERSCNTGVGADRKLPEPLSPTALAVTADGKGLFVACSTGNEVLRLDLGSGEILDRIETPAAPTGLALSRDGMRLYVTCAAPESWVCIVDVPRGEIVDQVSAGHTAMSPVLSADEKTLYVCNRFDRDVSIIDLEAKRSFRCIRVQREPIAAALMPDGRHLVVAGHLHDGRANRATAAAKITLVDTDSGTVVRDIPLRAGSGLVRGIAVSPDGAYAVVSHILAHYHWVPRMAYLGWINQNVVSLVDLRTSRLFATVPLDENGRGAANPWAVAWSTDGRWLYVTHAGTHELSVIDAPRLLERLHQLPEGSGDTGRGRARGWEYYRFPRYGSARSRFELPSDFEVLQGIRQRIPLTGNGPRALVLAGQRVCVAHYFSDSVDVVDLRGPQVAVDRIDLSGNVRPSDRRQGESCFNDATLCVQGWQSCASCHDADARCDGFNWDLLNDGPHNPKNTRSLLHASSTPPVMALGVRDSAPAAVRAGLQHILFGEPASEVAEAIDRYLESLRPVPSPHLVDDRLSGAAERGRILFHREDVGCATCHPEPLFTSQLAFDVGTAGDYDNASDHFDTPSLIEAWRTAPYLHDGSAATIRDVLTRKNSDDRHGRTSVLSAREIDDLAEYVLSL